jgi:transcription termination factor NusB
MVAAFVGSQRRPNDSGSSTTACRKCSAINLFSIELPPEPVTPSSISLSSVRLAKMNDNYVHYLPQSALTHSIREWLVPDVLAAEVGPPTQEEIKLLREAFATFYGVDRDLQKSEKLLSKAIDYWQRQPVGK